LPGRKFEELDALKLTTTKLNTSTIIIKNKPDESKKIEEEFTNNKHLKEDCCGSVHRESWDWEDWREEPVRWDCQFSPPPWTYSRRPRKSEKTDVKVYIVGSRTDKQNIGSTAQAANENNHAESEKFAEKVYMERAKTE
jgi:hypothetical protein